MNQDDRWDKNYRQILTFITLERHLPSRHRTAEHQMLNWLKYQRRLLSKGKLSAERTKRFNQLMELAENYQRINQYASKSGD